MEYTQAVSSCIISGSFTRSKGDEHAVANVYTFYIFVSSIRRLTLFNLSISFVLYIIMLGISGISDPYNNRYLPLATCNELQSVYPMLPGQTRV